MFLTPSSTFNKTCGCQINPSPLYVNRYYWTHTGLDIPANTKVNVLLYNTNLNLQKAVTALDDTTTMSMKGVINMSPKMVCWTTSLYSLSFVSWSAFRIDNIFYPLEAFHVANTDSIVNNDQISFNIIILTLGNGWKQNTNTFEPSYVGIYFVSFSGGIFSTSAQIDLMLNNVYVTSAYAPYFSSGSDIYSKSDMFSKSFMIKLLAGDSLSLVGFGEIYSTRNSKQITFSGFNYSPMNLQQVNYKKLLF